MTSPDDELVERVARAIAFWHGQKKVVAGETVAARQGYGSWGHSPEQYAEARWREYVEAARAAIAVCLEEAAKVAEGFRCGEQLIRHKMSHVDQVGVVAVTIAKAIRARNPKER